MLSYNEQIQDIRGDFRINKAVVENQITNAMLSVALAMSGNAKADLLEAQEKKKAMEKETPVPDLTEVNTQIQSLTTLVDDFKK